MTTIAWDGKALVADRRVSVGITTYSSTKIRRTPDGRLLGATGDWYVACAVLDWLEGLTGRPEGQTSDRWSTAIEAMPDGRCRLHVRDWKWAVEDGFTAIGWGRDYALAVMAVGRDARRGVEVAARFGPGTGNGIDVLELEAVATARPAEHGLSIAA